MKILTDQSLNEAIKFCKEDKPHRILIVTQYAEDHKFILDSFPEEEVEITRCFGHPWVKFPNGSIIQIISIASSTRGRRANLVLCQAEVYNNYEEAKYMLPAIEVENRHFKLLKDWNDEDD